MQKIIIMNAKGGCGKTTIATNLASYYASHGYKAALYDYDPQGSSMQWLERRPKKAAEIHAVAAYSSDPTMTRTWQLRLPADINRVIIDTPARPKQSELLTFLKGVNTILIPVLPSAIDTQATAGFVRELLLVAKAQMSHIRVAIIANRVDVRTNSYRSLGTFLDKLKIPVVGQLRDTVNYVRAADYGLGVHELPIDKVKGDSKVWRELVARIDKDFRGHLQRGEGVNAGNGQLDAAGHKVSELVAKVGVETANFSISRK